VKCRPHKLSKDKNLSVTKALLNSLSDDGNSGFEVYCEYFKSFYLSEDKVNLTGIRRNAITERKMFDSQYKLKLPQENPAFLDFFNHHDIERLAKLKSVIIVIYAAETLKSDISDIQVFHDFRLVGNYTSQPTYFYFYSLKQKELFTLAEPPELISLPKFGLRHSNQGRSIKNKEDEQINYASLIESLLFFEADTANIDPSYELPIITSAADLDLYSSHLYKRWKATKSVLIVTFCRWMKQGRWKNKCAFKDFYFMTLSAIISDSSDLTSAASISESEPQVMCLWDVNKICFLSNDFAKQMIQRHFDSTGWKETRSSKLCISGVKFYSEEERLNAKKQWDEARNKTKKQKLNDKDKTFFHNTQKCSCEICKASCDQYGDNMNFTGPEKLCSTQYSVSDLLQMLGSFDDQAKHDIDKMCELSIGAMDIESKTVEMSVGTPCPGPRIVYNEIDTAKLEGYSKKVQHPIMIAHIDAINLNSDRKVFTVKNDLPQACFDMMQEYWNYVLDCHRDLQEEKQQIAQRYYDIVNKYRKAYFDTANSWFQRIKDYYNKQLFDAQESTNESDGDARKDFKIQELKNLAEKFEYIPQKLEAGWRATIPGQLETALDKLIEQYDIFSFYGYVLFFKKHFYKVYVNSDFN